MKSLLVPAQDLQPTESRIKESNPKDAIGSKKPPHSTVSQAVMAEVGVGMLEGSIKYGRHNYREIGVRAEVYYDATRRHIDAWWEGEDIDPDSGLSHITKAICSLCVLRDAMIQSKLYDDRPPPTPPEHREYVARKTAEVFEKYKDREPERPYIKGGRG
jgi:hypothetical protein